MAREGNSEDFDQPLGSGGDRSEGSDVLAGFGINAGLVEEIRRRYEVDPNSVHASWREFFGATGGAAASAVPKTSPSAAVASPAASVEPALASATVLLDFGARQADKHARVLRLIHSYRARGHRIADTDPLGGQPSYFPELDPGHYGFGETDLDREYIAGDLPGGPVQTLRQILDRLRATYCRSVGVEFTHVQDPGRKAWLMQNMEQSTNTSPLRTTDRMRILENLSAAELFEKFLHTKFLGQKRFSLEGAESLIPLLDSFVEYAPEFGVRELVIGMAHRGRLNVLSNILGKSLESIFSEFEDSPLIDSPFGSGDVKYHKGYSNDRRVHTGEQVHLSLTANPSHLEAVNPVVEGRVRAKQEHERDYQGETIVPILVHGDAAFAGQGMVAETLNLSNLAGYTTGGTLHVIVNNQIGFTTTPAEARSTLYATDVAKMIQVPIFHVNGDDPEAVVHCVKLAMSYRQRFGEDVVIDLVCYRLHGHNEGDEPDFTQPLLYSKIRSKDSVRQIYTRRLLEMGILQAEDAERVERDLKSQLAQALTSIDSKLPEPEEGYEPHGGWKGFSRTAPDEEPETGLPIEKLIALSEKVGSLPAGFEVHRKLAALFEQRRKVVAENAPVDWAMGEALAFASLLDEGQSVRLSGQDSCRGTFSHRHVSVIHQATGEEFMPLWHLGTDGAYFQAYDSLLSEAAVLGFEYGYSLAAPHCLAIWEAQFGDFANGAQVIIDQFIASAQVKWARISGLVMLLPHGYEGQGPEHSSARIERFLQSCADDNLQVVNCTNSAQYFHVLRRQMKRNYRSPMVIFTPKSLLRSPQAASMPAQFVSGKFQAVIPDEQASKASDRVKRIVLCSGKVYYDLVAGREEHVAIAPDSVAIVRVEQLYPWPGDALDKILAAHPNVERVVWAQEEPANMGAWTFVRDRLQGALLPTQDLAYAGRRESASTATGSLRIHKQEQRELVAVAFAGLG
ncbi:MAG: 2-oxoglutarate dehydrogenase E1 component [Deltaproteobacteria bacterium]|nr:2-oxoglutarate dehydrogenase E1 component [Deltaproteobacteria bacterium]MBW2398916.1 2-oxoglutarate dehydrogenase E1 component [Deltaproteobacteria bacterium]